MVVCFGRVDGTESTGEASLERDLIKPPGDQPFRSVSLLGYLGEGMTMDPHEQASKMGVPMSSQSKSVSGVGCFSSSNHFDHHKF